MFMHHRVKDYFPLTSVSFTHLSLFHITVSRFTKNLYNDLDRHRDCVGYSMRSGIDDPIPSE